jgi:hypothetical protein
MPTGRRIPPRHNKDVKGLCLVKTTRKNEVLEMNIPVSLVKHEQKCEGGHFNCLVDWL